MVVLHGVVYRTETQQSITQSCFSLNTYSAQYDSLIHGIFIVQHRPS